MNDFFEPCFYAISVFIKWILIIYKFDIFGNEAMDLEKIYRESLVLFFDIFPFLSWCIISLYIYIFFNFYMIFLKDLNFIYFRWINWFIVV